MMNASGVGPLRLAHGPSSALEKFKKTEKEIGAFLGHFTFSHFPITHNDDCDFSAKYDIHSLEAVKNRLFV